MFLDKYYKAFSQLSPFKRIKPKVVEQQAIYDNLTKNRELITASIGNPQDLVITYFPSENKPEAMMVYFITLVDEFKLENHVVQPLRNLLKTTNIGLTAEELEAILPAANFTTTRNLHQAVDLIVKGNALLFIAGVGLAMSVSYPGYPKRAIEEPPTEKGTRGPREGFTETLRDNLGMVRRWVRDPSLRIEPFTIGERSKTDITVMYLKDVANPDIVEEVRKRLKQIHIDGIIDSGYISELIADRRTTFFPLVQSTERPDKVAASLLEGRVAILVDRSPSVLIVPVTSTEFYQIPEDFYLNYWVSSFVRILRGIGTFTSVTLPGFYVALISINPEFLPQTLAEVISSSRTLIPFPVVVEILLVLLVFEMFREAVVRVPANINIILGVAGGILLGLIAFNVGIISGITIMVGIITILTTFSTASVEKEQAWRLTRYFLLIGGSMLGVLGLTLAGSIVLIHLASLKSFGVSYLGPWAPPLAIEIADSAFRLPWWTRRRPPTYRPQQEDRLGRTKGEDGE